MTAAVAVHTPDHVHPDIRVRACRAVLGRSVLSFFGRDCPRNVSNLAARLLAADVHLVSDLLKVGPTELRGRFKATIGVTQWVAEKLNEVDLPFTDETAVMLRALEC